MSTLKLLGFTLILAATATLTACDRNEEPKQTSKEMEQPVEMAPFEVVKEELMNEASEMDQSIENTKKKLEETNDKLGETE